MSYAYGFLVKYKNEIKKGEINMDADLSVFENSNKSNKIPVDFLAIKANIIDNRPYYTIIYHPINSESSYEWYGSYSLYLVNERMVEHFIMESPVI
jgi:hypothetical protein